jgi:hypothetical protein
MFIKTFCVRLDNSKKIYSNNIMSNECKTFEEFKEKKRLDAELLIMKQYREYLDKNPEMIYNLTTSIPYGCYDRNKIMLYFHHIYSHEKYGGDRVVIRKGNIDTVKRMLSALSDGFEYKKTLLLFVEGRFVF